ncbi:hypothetical protein HDU78_000976 [Chytriomyces hyalinus]|nr:hypothetical protein HDU78_000976 [Chytriomyces hyalinus]KAJ3265646.1 hypothetical protein HDU77_004419 [Chytriomyces hyalinus]
MVTQTPKPDDKKPATAAALTQPANVSEISFATLLGLCSGYAAKKFAKGAGFVIGASFLALQGLAMTGVITIDWKRIESEVTKRLDADGDGKLTTNDIKAVGLRLVHNLSKDLPSAGGFSAAFFIGFRYG